MAEITEKQLLSTLTEISEDKLTELDPVEVITSAHLHNLVDCLKGAHDAGVVHRDVRPENIMLDRNGVARLIDWGCAAFTTNAVSEAGITGTFRYASDEVLEAAIHGIARKPHPKDDLESLVRVVLAINSVVIVEELAELEQGDFQRARALWQKKRSANQFYEGFFVAAAQCDYETVKGLVFY